MKKSFLRSVLSGMLLAIPFSSFALDQWASKVLAFSTQYTTANWSAAQTLGAPNTKNYGDYSTSWTASTPDAGMEFVTVSFTTPVYATGVTIRETLGYGFVTGVEAIDTSNVAHVVWSGTDTSASGGVINNFLASWPRTTYLVTAVKVKINTALHSGYDEIDAIQLHGLESLSGTIAPRFTHTATLVCKNNTTGQTITTAISGTGLTAPPTKWDCQKAGLKFSAGNTVSIQITGVIAP